MKTKTGLKQLFATPVWGLLAGILMLIMLCGSVSAQTTWHVDDDNCPGPGMGTVVDPFCSIQDAIDARVVLPVEEDRGIYTKGVALVSSAGISSNGARVRRPQSQRLVPNEFLRGRRIHT